MGDARQMVLVVNPTSGGGRGRRAGEAAVALLREAGLEPRLLVTQHASEPERVARAAAADGAQMVVAVGGDGHAAAVAEGLIGSATTLGLLPAGSANDYARSLGMPRDLRAAVGHLVAGRAVHVDTIRLRTARGERRFLNVCGAGFDAAVAAAAERIPLLRGAGRYVLAIMRVLPAFGPAMLRVSVDGECHEMRGMMVAVANGTTYGGGMRVAPDARLDSGTLEVCVVGDVTRVEFVRAFPRVFRGTHVTHPKVTMLRGREIELEADRPLGVIGDGELAGELPARLSLDPASLRVVIGAGHALGRPISKPE